MATATMDDLGRPAALRIAATAVPLTRDLRLDFFRGIAMFIIMVAHIQFNWLAQWMPAQFGFSDAAEMFVFCSGMASALGFGRVFREQGLVVGTARVAFRVWQVYWAHIGLFLMVAVTTIWLTQLHIADTDYTTMFNLYRFFGAPMVHLPALLTLTYVPNYFDILPMYIVILAMIPLVIALSRIHLLLVALLVVGLWLWATTTGTNFPAEPNSPRRWFFNPFAWQLVFFTGFAIMSGWIKPPAIEPRLVWLAIAIVALAVPFAHFRFINLLPDVQAWRKANDILINKTNFGALRYVHFLALAYLGMALAGPRGARLDAGPAQPVLARIWAKLLPVILTVGRQSLAVFVFSMFYAVLLSALFDAVGRSHFSTLWVNILGAAGVATAAYTAQWFKAKPWTKKEVKS